MSSLALRKVIGGFAMGVVLTGCATVPPSQPGPLVLKADKSNAVAYWHDIGAATVSAKAASSATDAEKYASFPADLATMHLAMYDAAMAIDGRFQPFGFAPDGLQADASLDAALGASAHGVLRVLFPSRAALYERAYEEAMAAVPEGSAKARGQAIGLASAAAHLARRKGDGRAGAMAPYAENPAPGRFRGQDPINRHWPLIRPFTLTTIAQFRPPAPPALGSAQYTADFNEVKALGGKDSASRSATQWETARFHSEPPVPYFTRNFGRFARTTASAADASRLMAVLYTGYADAIAACMEAKYHYDTWRPQTAIPLAGTDDNPATVADPGWTPAFPTPKHPEYPAAHSCSAGAVGELLRHYYGTDKLTFTWDSKVSDTTRTYADTDALAEESRMARIYGGMHFRYSTTAGAELGKHVANWTMQHAFQPRPAPRRVSTGR